MASIAEDRARRRLLERVAVLQSRAAMILRANGRPSEAARAEQFAARNRLILDEPHATRQMRALTRRLHETSDTDTLYGQTLEGAMSLIGGDLGNVQIRDPTTGRLRIVAHSGFGSEFLEYFALVEDDTSACGRAANQHSQTVIVDVNEDTAFAPHREIAAAARFRAVQSTPLVDPTGRLHGVVSTHFRHSHRPSPLDLELMQWYAELVAAALAEPQTTPSPLHAATGRLLARTAALHDNTAVRINNSALALLANGNESRALTMEQWASHVRDRAQEQRERAQALAERIQDQNDALPPPRSAADG